MQFDALFSQNILQDVLFFVKAAVLENLINFLTILGQMAHNVPAVYDVASRP
jgi:hypothetical protein